MSDPAMEAALRDLASWSAAQVGLHIGKNAATPIERTAGADLVQVYTGLIYRGPALVPECARALWG